MVIGSQGQPGTATYSDGDRITGTDSTTLQVTIAQNGQPTTTINGVGNLKLTSSVVGGGQFDYSANTNNSIVSIENSRSTTSLTVNNIGNANQAFAVNGVTAANAFASNFNFDAGVLKGTADNASLAINGVGNVTAAGTHTINVLGGAANQGYEALSIVSSGAASRLQGLNVVDANGAATLQNVSITGNQNLRIDGPLNFSALATKGVLDASAFTGNLNVNLDNNVVMTVTGGTGDDTFRFGGSLTGADSVDGGEGFDTLGANTTGQLSAAFTAGKIKNIEALQIQVAPLANSTLDVSKVGDVNAVSFFGGTGNFGVVTTINNLADNATISIGAGGGGEVAANIKNATQAGSNNTLNVALGTATDAAAIFGGTVTAAGVENINIATLGTGGQAAINSVNITGSASLKNIVVTGDEGLTVNSNWPSQVAVYDASKSNGIQDTSLINFSNGGATITGGSRADTLQGGQGGDVIVGGLGDDDLFGNFDTEADTMTGGDGQDTFFGWTNGNTANSSAAATVSDVFADFTLGSGGDVLNLTVNPNAQLPVQNGIISSVKITSLNASLPAAAINPTDAGRAELIILDSNVAALQANSPQAVNNLLFNLAGSGAYTQVLVAYASSATGDAQLAFATIAGGDITNITQIGTLKGITTDALAAGFNAANLVGTQAVGGNFAILANTVVNGTAGNDVFTAANAAAFNNAVVNGQGGVDQIVVANVLGANVTVGDGAAGGIFTQPINGQFGTLTLQGGTAANVLTIADTFALNGINVTNTSAVNGSIVDLGTGFGNTFTNGSVTVDQVVLGGAFQTATLGANDIVAAAVVGSTVNFAGAINAGLAADGVNASTAGRANYNGTGVADTLTFANFANAQTFTTGTLTGVETLNLGAPTAAINVTVGNGSTGTTTAIIGDTTGGNITINSQASFLQGLATAGGALTSVAAGNTFNYVVNDTGAVTLDLTNLVFTTAANVDNISLAASSGSTVTIDQVWGVAGAAFLTQGAGNDTLNIDGVLGAAAWTLNLGGGANNIVNVNIADAIVTANVIQSTTTTNTLNVNANVTTAALNLGTTMDVFGTVNFTVDQVAGGNAVTINNNATQINAVGGDFILGTGGDTFTATGNNANVVTATGADTINLAGGADTVIFSNTGATATGGAAVDRFQINDAAAAFDFVTDFQVGAGGDIIQISGTNTTVAGNAITAAIGTVAQVAAQLANNANNVSVAVLTDQGYASAVAAWNAINSDTVIAESGGTMLTFFNTTTNRAEVWYDTNLTIVGGLTQTVALTDVTSVGQLAGIIGTNFSYVA